jgi:cobalt-zinc-cadmium efflux system membrane fusion protein
MYVDPTDVMFRIINTEDLHAEAQVFEKDITKLKVGQLVRLKLVNDSRERLAIVYLIGREVTPERTVRVHCHFEKEDPLLIPGMYFSAVIETDQKSVPTLPDEAVVHFEGKKYVFVSTTSDTLHFRMTEIKTATSESGFTQVTSPEISNLHHVVIRGAYELLSTMKNNQQ